MLIILEYAILLLKIITTILWGIVACRIIKYIKKH